VVGRAMVRIECNLILSLSAPREYIIASRSIILLSVRIETCNERPQDFRSWLFSGLLRSNQAMTYKITT